MGDGRRKSSESISEREVKPLSIKQNMLWNSFGSITYLACQWLITILVVRLSSGYEAAGTLSLAMSVYNIFAPFAIYRMYTYQVSDVKRENTVGSTLRFASSLRRLLGLLSRLRCADLSGVGASRYRPVRDIQDCGASDRRASWARSGEQAHGLYWQISCHPGRLDACGVLLRVRRHGES